VAHGGVHDPPRTLSALYQLKPLSQEKPVTFMPRSATLLLFAVLASVPEPASFALLGAGLLGFALLRNRRRTGVVLAAVVAGMFSIGAKAQGPDYSNVNDFLNGRRTLLQIDDLVVTGSFASPPFQCCNTPLLSNIQSYTLGTKGSAASPISTNTWGSNSLPYNQNKTYTARMWATLNAQPIVLGVSGAPSSLSLPDAPYYVGPSNWASYGAYFFDPIFGNHNYPDVAQLAVADFNQDGYDDLLLDFASSGTMVIATAGDVNNFNAGSAPPFNYGPAANLDWLSGMTTGDFNGDGRPEIAGLVYLGNGGVDLAIYTVDPHTLAISRAARVNLLKPGQNNLQSLSITTGRFTSTTHDQIVVAYMRSGIGTTLQLIDFPSSSLTPNAETTYTFLSSFGPIAGLMKVTHGKFALPGNPYDQVVFAYALAGNPQPNGVGNNTKYINVLRIDPNTLVWTPSSFYEFSSTFFGWDIAVGNFDNNQITGGTFPDLTIGHDPNDQIAVLLGACASPDQNNIRCDWANSQDQAVNIVGVDPATWVLNTLTSNPLPGGTTFYATNLNKPYFPQPSLSLTQSDTQGRSLLLGEPTKITIDSTVQPSVVVGVPPMHVDFVSPDPFNHVPPEVLNLSAVPDGFKMTYQLENSTGKSSGTTNTTSWSFGAKESIALKESIGDVSAGEGEEASDTVKAAQDLKGSADHDYSSYQRQAYNLSATTGFGDEVNYTDSGFNIWVYPVLGQTVCPASKPNCQPSEKVPLTIQFSAPNGDALPNASQGQAHQWYQPPWEPGNIFSYPANLQQLKSIYPNLQLLTTDNVQIFTDTSTITQGTTWSVGGSDTKTTSFDQNYSFENDASITGAWTAVVASASVTADIDISGSFGFSNLSKHTTDLGTSTGVQITKPGSFPLFQTYGYSVSPYIMGTTKPGGFVDSEPLSGDVQTFGLLRAMFTVDPLDNGAGPWWQQAYTQAPDVALNHPSRWQIVPPSGTPGSNCLAAGAGTYDCAELTPREPANPMLSVFHQMRGFFISSANFPGQGPQLEQATAGDVLTLQARVYNYSLKAMDPGTQVHARFYFQPMNGTVPAGDSVLIGEDVLDPIFPFSNVPNAPLNWVLASTTFDTSKYDQTKNGNANVLFWVVVWMANNRALASEMPGHGLTAIPGTLKSLADAARLEECQKDGNCYSNNVGYYKQIFYIAQPAGSGLQGAPPPSGPASLDISKVELSARRITPHDTVAVSATISADGADASGISANFYDGNPREGGRLFDVERIPHIAQDASFPVLASYQTGSCGTHELFLVVNGGKSNEVVRRAPPVRVECLAARRR
jgi:hypothetical protein